MGKTVRKSLNGRNLQQLTKVTKDLYLYKKYDPRGLSAPADFMCLSGYVITWVEKQLKEDVGWCFFL